MKSETRRYKIKGFRDDGNKIRILLESADLVQQKEKQPGITDMMRNPMGTAQHMMGQQMNKMIHDSFSISKEEYQQKKYMVGEFIIVSLHREQR